MDMLVKIHSEGNTDILVTHEEDISSFRIIRLRGWPDRKRPDEPQSFH